MPTESSFHVYNTDVLSQILGVKLSKTKVQILRIVKSYISQPPKQLYF